MIKSYSDLEVYKLSFQLAMDIFNITKKFPVEEKYSLTSQIIRSSRSIATNIAEGFGRRTYGAEFKKHLVYSTGSLEESRVWLKFALDCKYISESDFNNFVEKSNELGAKLYKLYINWGYSKN